jgi:hypothetical protein
MIRSLMRKEASQAGDIVNWVCVQCNFTSDRSKNLFSHIQAKHVQSGYVCSTCSKYCKTLNALDAHQRRYHKMWFFYQNVTNFIFLIAHDLEIESKMMSVMGNDGKYLWQCTECEYSSNRKFNTQAHIEAKHLALLSSYKCPYCQHICFTKNAIRKHLRRCNKNPNMIP